jgi:predicted N-acyltransferase
MGASSVHITFPTKQEWDRVGQLGYLQRIGMQYHWKNCNYGSFDDFLMDLKQSKRKNIRQERKKVGMSTMIICMHLPFAKSGIAHYMDLELGASDTI